MKQLGVRFSETQHQQIADLSDVLNANNSDIARAALSLGMNQILELCAVKKESALELVVFTAFKAKQ